MYSAKALEAHRNQNLVDFRPEKVHRSISRSVLLGVLLLTSSFFVPFRTFVSADGYVAPIGKHVLLRAHSNVYVKSIDSGSVSVSEPILYFFYPDQLVMSKNTKLRTSYLKEIEDLKIRYVEDSKNIISLSEQKFLNILDNLEDRALDIRLEARRLHVNKAKIEELTRHMRNSNIDKRTLLEYSMLLDEIMADIASNNNREIDLVVDKLANKIEHIEFSQAIKGLNLQFMNTLMQSNSQNPSYNDQEPLKILSPISGLNYPLVGSQFAWMSEGEPLAMILDPKSEGYGVYAYFSDVNGLEVGTKVDVKILIESMQSRSIQGVVQKLSRARSDVDFLYRKLESPMYQVQIELLKHPSSIYLGRNSYDLKFDMKAKIRVEQGEYSFFQSVANVLAGY